ncbi:MAG: hypothetical protein E6J41_09815 [Chloroflexi bacterium]|nr:MAG: hypothetical protein E6J41_09815 [Chloroflexota bacterium]
MAAPAAPGPGGLVNVRLRRLPLWPMMAAGVVTGFVAGFFIGCVLGALLAWFSGAVLDWHRQLGFTLGVTEALLPLGDQIGLLQTLNDFWWLVVPGTGLVLGALNAIVGTLAGGLAAGVFNRFSHGVWLEVEVPSREEGRAPTVVPDAARSPRRAG